MVVEEKNHAIILTSAEKISLYAEGVPEDLIPAAEKELREFNNNLKAHLEKIKKNEIGRDEAFNLALRFESGAGEVHYQMLMEKSATSRFVETLQLLNSDDKDHFERILKYMKENNIPITTE